MLTDTLDYDKIDPGIRKLVWFLRTLGFRTTDSGDGVSKPSTERMIHRPHVYIEVDPRDLLSETDRVYRLLGMFGVDLTGDCVDEVTGQVMPKVSVEGTYTPHGVSGILVTGVSDKDGQFGPD